jgi:sulfide dehydrogenase cytochrome subunit
MTKRFPQIVVALLFIGAISAGCQTTTAPTALSSSTAVQTTKPTESKTGDVTKPINAENARVLANNCYTCHGPNGRSPGGIPSLSSLNAGDIAARLKSFKSGALPSTVMGRHAKAYSDAEIDAIAAVIAAPKK